MLEDITWHVWGVLGFSFAVDGAVLARSLYTLYSTKPEHMSFWAHLGKVRDPTTIAVLLEDSAACGGVLVAVGGIGLSQLTGQPVYDNLAEFTISGILAGMGLALVRLNMQSLLGKTVEPDIQDDIRKILLDRPSIDDVRAVQAQWEGPYLFSYKADLDFDGTYIAARLHERYAKEFLSTPDMERDLKVLLAWYAEDVVRVVEREVKELEAQIRTKYPEAAFIELVRPLPHLLLLESALSQS